TNAEVLSYDKLFATLDSTTRRLVLPEGREITLTDTVGFIQKLPTTLIEAFKSTLDEINGADLILHVIDCSDENFLDQIETVNMTLEQIDAETIPRIEVFNKIDKLTDAEIEALSQRFPEALLISSLEKIGLEELIKRISLVASSKEILLTVEIPYTEGSLVSLAHKKAQILNENYTEKGTKLTLRISPAFVPQFKPFEVEE
ncbi:MAG: HflX GTPase family protein, partial [Anaerotardibacter sp.]